MNGPKAQPLLHPIIQAWTSRLGGPHIPVHSSVTQASHLLGHVNGVRKHRDKSNHTYAAAVWMTVGAF